MSEAGDDDAAGLPAPPPPPPPAAAAVAAAPAPAAALWRCAQCHAEFDGDAAGGAELHADSAQHRHAVALAARLAEAESAARVAAAEQAQKLEQAQQALAQRTAQWEAQQAQQKAQQEAAAKAAAEAQAAAQAAAAAATEATAQAQREAEQERAASAAALEAQQAAQAEAARLTQQLATANAALQQQQQKEKDRGASPVPVSAGLGHSKGSISVAAGGGGGGLHTHNHNASHNYGSVREGAPSVAPSSSPGSTEGSPLPSASPSFSSPPGAAGAGAGPVEMVVKEDEIDPRGHTAALTSSELSELSLKFFPELEPLLGAIPPAPAAHVYTAAAAYLYDSFHCRSIKHSTTLLALQAYQFIHVSRWKLFVRWIGWMHLLLGFIEPPSSIMTDGERHGPSHLVCGLIELLFLFIYSFHAYKQYVAYGPGSKGYWRSPWRTGKLIVLVACYIDVIISIARNTDDPGIHLSQILRVFFVLEQSGRMRQLCSCIIKSLPAIISIMFLCFLHIAVFALIGYMFIRPLEELSPLTGDEGKLYFSSLGRAFLSTFILLTSENFPEVMLPSYRKHWFVCIFFIIFVIIGLYGLLQLTTAVVFHSFQMHTKDKLQSAMHYRERAMQASFTLLSEYGCGDGIITLETWQKLTATLRPDWTPLQSEILFKAATTREESEMEAPSATATGSKKHSSSADVMTFLQFEQIVRFTQKSFQFQMTPQRHAAPAAAKAVAASADCAGTSTDDVGIDISMQSVNSKGGRPSAASLAYPDPAVQASPLHRPVVAPSALSSSDGPTVASTWGGVVPAFVLDYPAMAALAKVLIWYFNYRVPIPHWLGKHVLGRSEANIVEREEEEGPIDTTVAGPTPLEPVLSVRTQLTTFSLSELLVDCLTVFHGFLLILRLALNSNDASVRGDALESLDVMVIILQVVFLLEMAVKLWLCRARFFNSRLNKLDAMTILIIWVAQIVISSRDFGGAEDAVSCIRLARLFRLHHRLNSFTLLLQVLTQVGPALVALLGVLFILLYTYSMIGMWWFCNELMLGKLNKDLDYDQGDFYVLNFNDLAHSLIALFYQLVVNDWWILMEAVVFRVGDAARIFFVSFYAISVLIVFSVCTAFVVEAYMDMHEAKVQASLKGKAAAVATQLESLSMPMPVSLAAGAANAANVNSKHDGGGAGRGGGGGGGGGDKSRQGQGGFSVPSLRPLASVGRGGGQPGSAADPSTPRSGGRPAVLTTSKSFRQFAQAVHQKSVGPLQRGNSMARQSSMNARSGNRSVASAAPAEIQASRPTGSSMQGQGGAAAAGRQLFPTSASAAPQFGSAAVGGAGGGGSIESLLLSRIRDRAGSMGLKVKLQPPRGMFHTLTNIFGADLEEEEEEPLGAEMGEDADEPIVEEGEEEKAED